MNSSTRLLLSTCQIMTLAGTRHRNRCNQPPETILCRLKCLHSHRFHPLSSTYSYSLNRDNIEKPRSITGFRKRDERDNDRRYSPNTVTGKLWEFSDENEC